MKTGLRIITLILAAVLVLGLFSGVFAMLANAADEPTIITADTAVSSIITYGKTKTGLTITFSFVSDTDWTGADESKTYSFSDFSLPTDSSFSWSENSELIITKKKEINAGVFQYSARVTKIDYNGGTERILRLDANPYSNLYDNTYTQNFLVPISAKYFRSDTSSSEEEEEKRPEPEIVVESVSVISGSGQKLEEVTKDTPPFTVEIVFSDIGLIEERTASLEEGRFHTYITASDGFKTIGGTSGTLKLITAGTLYPRFRATFTNIQCDGTNKKLGFKVVYDLEDYTSSITKDQTADLWQITTTETEEDKKTTPLKPNVIVQSYDYGGEPIVAGTQFNLDLVFGNTSKDSAVENVVLTIEEGTGFQIAAASNTVYFNSITPGQTLTHSVLLQANPAAATGSSAAGTAPTDYSVKIKFKYQYLSADTDKEKTYADHETEVKIAIPVAQLDRFGVDEITDYSQYITMGEEGYVTVPITNKGKSPTYNIMGSIRCAGADFVAPSVHYGNLEAGKSATLDISLTINTPGEFNGEAVIAYEDENMQQKELTVPFTIMVNEPYVPPPEAPPAEQGAIGPEAPNPLSIVFCAFGALLIAVPIALYLIKRLKAKGSGDIDEDF